MNDMLEDRKTDYYVCQVCGYVTEDTPTSKIPSATLTGSIVHSCSKNCWVARIIADLSYLDNPFSKTPTLPGIHRIVACRS